MAETFHDYLEQIRNMSEEEIAHSWMISDSREENLRQRASDLQAENERLREHNKHLMNELDRAHVTKYGYE